MKKPKRKPTRPKAPPVVMPAPLVIPSILSPEETAERLRLGEETYTQFRVERLWEAVMGPPQIGPMGEEFYAVDYHPHFIVQLDDRGFCPRCSYRVKAMVDSAFQAGMKAGLRQPRFVTP